MMGGLTPGRDVGVRPGEGRDHLSCRGGGRNQSLAHGLLQSREDSCHCGRSAEYLHQTVIHEITAGVPRLDALRALDHRTGIDEVRQLVNVLAQAERFGTSVARALRVHADMVRQKRMLAAEEEAAKISPKLTVVMILFIMPSLFTVLMGPAAVQVYRNFVDK